MQLDLFGKGRALKEEGQERVAAHNAGFMYEMRLEARRIATLRGSVTSDDLRLYAAAAGLKPTHPNAWGAIFRETEWEVIGRTPSKVIDNHGREIRVWALRREGQGGRHEARP